MLNLRENAFSDWTPHPELVAQISSEKLLSSKMGCQIFIFLIYQNGRKYTIPICH
jgi:hypothetical protein